jgi:LCP family protein required for cell wall assembly
MKPGSNSVGLPASKKEVKKTPKSAQLGQSLVKKSENETAIRDFLSSVQDSDPTDLISTPLLEDDEDQARKDKKTDKKTARRMRKELESTGSPKKKHKIRKIILSVLGIIIVIAIGLGIWAYIQGNDLVSRITGGGNLWDMITADPDTPLEKDPVTGRTNVLIFGTEGYSMDDPNYDGGQLTDSIMVASINQETGDIKTVSLPRDLKSKTCTSTSKLNEIYYCNYSKNNGTAESRQEYEVKAATALAAEVEKILGIKIQYQVHVNWQALIQIVDSIGGIDVVFTYGDQKWDGPEIAIETTSKKGLADWNRYCKCYVINFPNGEAVHLDGKKALAVARTRNEAGGWGASSGNFSREIFQQKIIQATALKTKNTNFATDFIAALKIKDAVGDNLRMNFKDKELKTLFKLASNVDINSMRSISLQNTDDKTTLLTTGLLPVPGVNNLQCGGDRPGCLSYVYPKAGATNYSEIHKYIARKLGNSDASTAAEDAKITVMNATTVTGLAASEGEKLTAKGFSVAKTANAPTDLKGTDGIIIYQLNSTMPKTAKSLTDFYNVKITTTVPKSLTSETSDFVVIIGNGYSSRN